MPDDLQANSAQVAPVATPQEGTTPQAEPQAGEAQTGLTLEQALDALKKVRNEAAGYRTKLNAFEQAQQDAERAKLSKEEQLQAQVADKERAYTELQRQHQEALVAHAIDKAASKIGIVDTDAALKLLDMSQLEYDGDGKPKNAEKLLRDLAQSRPWLAGTPAVSPSNPQINHSQRGDFKESSMEDFGSYLKNEAEWKKAMREGRVIKG